MNNTANVTNVQCIFDCNQLICVFNEFCTWTLLFRGGKRVLRPKCSVEILRQSFASRQSFFRLWMSLCAPFRGFCTYLDFEVCRCICVQVPPPAGGSCCIAKTQAAPPLMKQSSVQSKFCVRGHANRNACCAVGDGSARCRN